MKAATKTAMARSIMMQKEQRRQQLLQAAPKTAALATVWPGTSHMVHNNEYFATVS